MSKKSFSRTHTDEEMSKMEGHEVVGQCARFQQLQLHPSTHRLLRESSFHVRLHLIEPHYFIYFLLSYFRKFNLQAEEKVLSHSRQKHQACSLFNGSLFSILFLVKHSRKRHLHKKVQKNIF
ncbi:hypothetical protein MPTK1_6g01340 [Marchantia polymorpha subsp. ruderalis]|uniref:Uncharacterized protein n=2 Tax=Marchantia polymorpha TaxID=3197 RepID=A0AAF6BMC7_MARPO|nr:hypothetical protein MARPO_0052s0070 [Marchantia polymorpha]BBN13161.1 hypothetical protein Mp_6g01340 [Marchantia polymorpha subsp. ruderalis]|eukprot:PTQ38286.1 hypothetical protein MARPO_0052s0070 [Marchantia polymorpha]